MTTPHKLPLLAVGLCTYRRPTLLRSCLESIAAADKPKDLSIIFIVADNDPEGSGESVVRDFEKETGLVVNYTVEKGRGIPFARNNVLKRALAFGATELAFLDDDETADTAWLVRLWAQYQASGADVARGFVETIYPADAPRWLVRGKFYRRSNHPTGTTFNSASTNNVLWNINKIAGSWGIFFDESFGRRGGSDSDYFLRASARGAVITWAADAIVYETLERERYSLSYLLKRKFRTRNARSFFNGLSAPRRLSLFVRSLWKVVSGVISLPFSFFLGGHVVIRVLCGIVEGSGRILGLFGAHIDWNEYHAE